MIEPVHPDDDDSAGQHDSYGLIMPFVVVESNGGPLDDLAYAAGFEAGQIDALLGLTEPRAVHTTHPVHVENVAQLDLIAMRRGFTMERASDVVDGWLHVRFVPA